MQIWPHSRMDWKKEIKRRGCVVLTHPLLFCLYQLFVLVVEHHWHEEHEELFGLGLLGRKEYACS